MNGSTRGIFLFSLLIITSISIVSAVPPLPAEYYGNVLIDGSPAPAGTVVTILMQNIPKGSLTTDIPGFYGGPGLFDPRLKINATEDEYKAGNLTVSFRINGVPASQTIPFEPGTSQQFDLSTVGQGGQKVSLAGVTPVPALIPSLEKQPLVSDNITPLAVSGISPPQVLPRDNTTSSNVVSDNYSTNAFSGDTNMVPPTYPVAIGGSYSSPSVRYGLEKEKVFISDDGLASLLCEKDTMLFSPDGQFLHDISITSRSIANLPPVVSDRTLRFSGYAYDITPGRTYFNPEGVFTIHIPLERRGEMEPTDPRLYAYDPQTATWSQVRTKVNTFTGNVSGTIHEATVYALYLADTTGSAIQPQAGAKEMQEPVRSAISQDTTSSPVNSTAGTISSPAQHVQPLPPVKETVTAVSSASNPAPNLTVSAGMAENNTKEPEIIPSSPVPAHQEGTSGSISQGAIISFVKKGAHTPAAILAGGILLVILANILAYLLYTRWWLKRS